MPELAKTYSAADVEPEIAARWEQANAFHAEPDPSKPPYSIVIPPPNVTAALHMGHGLNNTLQDILTRHHRMRGFNAMWMPGTDHAGIATQTVVEKRVLAEEGKKRTDFDRDEFVSKIQAWKDEYEQVITNQLKTMGCSCDWQRQRFTMDDTCAAAVREAFFQLFKDGLIYRGKRLVNWDPATQTALADDEVEMEDVDGHFYYMKYPLVEDSKSEIKNQKSEIQYVTVATTRPETMLGDTAVAINPKDPRAEALRGKQVRLPIVGRVIPIVEDDYVVLPDPESDDAKAKMATGFLKVTPAHDPNDYEIGQRHDLPIINVMGPDGSISDQHGWTDGVGDGEFLLGLDRYEARKAIIEWFRQNDLLEDVKPHKHAVGHSYRSHVPIEPYYTDQWYVKVTDDRLAGAALRALGNGENHRGTEAQSLEWEGRLKFTPERYAKTFQTWHENIRDWCISRQLWWGHRIPVWSRDADTKPEIENLESEVASLNKWIAENRIAVNWSKASDTPISVVTLRDFMTHICVRDENDRDVTTTIEQWGFKRDPDVLDTWFSSALWPISTMGWPNETPELAQWNPSSCLSTAREIITLWVSRMVMFNLYFRDCLPFTDVFIHAMIQDGDGRKMSKSLGNGVDPLDIIHSHGSDAMRFTLTKMTTQTQDVRLPVKRDEATGRNTSDKFDEGRNFANKLWNATRFALSNLEEATPTDDDSSANALVDRWILSRLARAVQAATDAIAAYDFNGYAQGLYDFAWRDLCDWYIEAIKPTVKTSGGAQQQRVLATCLDTTLRLLHPMMPFITEKLWEQLNATYPQRGVAGLALPANDLLIKAAWPEADAALINEPAEVDFDLAQEIVGGVREVRSNYKLPPRQGLTCSIKTAHVERITSLRSIIETMGVCDLTSIAANATAPDDAATARIGDVEIYVHGVIDADAEKQRLTKALAEAEKSIGALNGRLNNKGYTDKAPAHLVQQTRDQLAAMENQANALREQLKQLA